MKRILFAAAVPALLATSAATAAAQNRAPVCPTSTNPGNAGYYTADACEKAIDLFGFMAPQLGTSIAGGSAVMGKGGTLGGLGHFSVGARVNVVDGSLPQILDQRPTTGGAEQSNYETKRQVVPMPVVDAAVGVFKGIPVGVTSVGGIDLLANVSYMRDFNTNGVDVAVRDGQWKFGYGARLGLLQESLVSPGISVSYIRRDLPVVNVGARVEGDGTPATIGSVDHYELNVADLDVQTQSWRVTASKSLLVFGLMVGAGQDRYSSGANVLGRAYLVDDPSNVTPPFETQLELKQSLTRTNIFGGVTLNMMMFKLALEGGQVSGGEIETYNTFDKKPNASRYYGSLGLRIGR